MFDSVQYSLAVAGIRIGRRALLGSLNVRGDTDFSRGAIIAANHQSVFDAPILMNALAPEYKIYFLSKRSMGWVPFSRVNRTFLDSKEKPRRKNLEDLQEAEDSGSLIGIFPEGTRNKKKDGDVGKLKLGVFKLSNLLELEVRPCGINYHAREGRVGVYFGETFNFDMKELRTNSERTCELLRAEIQNCYEMAK